MCCQPLCCFQASDGEDRSNVRAGHTQRRSPWPVHTWPLTSSTSQQYKQHTTLLKHLVALRKLFLRMMRSIYYWRSGLTLHLFGVALMEWGSCSCERLAMHPSAFPFYILVYFTLVRLDSVFLSSPAPYSMFLYAGYLCLLTYALMHVWSCERNPSVHCVCVVLPHR